MNRRRFRLILWALSGTFGIVSILAVGGTWLWPLDLPQVSTDLSSMTRASASSSDARAMPALDTFESIWRLNLQRPLFDAPPPVAVRRAVPKPPSLAVKLAGTVVESGRSKAMFIASNGKVEFKGVGENISGAELLEITPERVSVRYRGKTVDLVLERKDRLQ